MLLLSLESFSQKEAYNWYFGNRAALNFSTGEAVSLDNSNMLAWDGCASLSDSSGNLLFYSNGEKIWNKEHQVMPNGNGLFGYNGATQSALFIPIPEASGKYLLFTMGNTSLTGQQPGCFYSMIDMNLDNGRGDIISYQKNLFLSGSDSANDVMMAVSHGNSKDYWLIIRSFSEFNCFKSYRITMNGIGNDPVISDCIYDITSTAAQGTSKVSPDGKYYIYARTEWSLSNPRGTELYTVNSLTGYLTPVFAFAADDDSFWVNGAEFSANSEYLYLSINQILYPPITYHTKVKQFDMSKLNNVDLFESSGVTLYHEESENGFEQMQIGPDGKIYAAHNLGDNKHMARINYPAKHGIACEFEKEAVELIRGNTLHGLPTFIQSYFVRFSWLGNCLGDSTHFSSWFLPEPESIQWDFGDPGSGSNNFSNLLNPAHQFSGQGNFTVSAIASYPNGRTESYVREVWINPYPVFELGEDQSICQGDEVTLSSGVMLAQCLWNTGATTPSITVSDPGEYSLRVENNNGCIFRDTVSVYLFPEPSLDTTNLILSPTTCGGSTGAIRGLTVSGTEPIALEWKNNAGTVLSNEEDIYNLPVGNYYLWATDGNGCNNLVSQYTISDAGDVLIASVSHSDSYCGQNNGSITITAVSGLSDLLEYSIDNGTTWHSNEGLFEGLNPVLDYDVRVRVPDGSGCEAVYAFNPVMIDDFSGPQVIASSEPATGSNANGSITLTATGFGNLSYTLNGGTPQSSGEFTGLIAGTYTWRVEDENGCFTEGSIEVGQEAGFIISAIAGNSAVCLGNAPVAPLLIENFTGVQAFTATLEYDATLVNCEGFRPGSIHPQLEANLIAEVYPASQRIVVTWSGSAPLTLSGSVTVLDLVFSATQVGNSFLTWDQAPSATWFTGEYGSIEPEFQIGQIQVNHPPVLAQQLPINICEGELAWLSATATGNEPLTYQWTLPDGSNVNDPFLIFLNASSTHAGQYRVKVSDALGCSDSTLLTLQVTPNPADWFLQDTILFENQYLLAGPAGYASYSWSTGDTLPEITVNTEGLYTLQLTTHNLCAGADSTYLKMLEAESPFLVPNAFTPNNDGLNDTFRPVVDYERVRQFSMVIYNRWGQMIFETNNPAEGWDGKDAPEGVYSWVVSYSNQTGKGYQLKGVVTLIK
jgi:gliding motility-associated-like protein